MILVMAAWGCGAAQEGPEIDRAALMDPTSAAMNEQAPADYKAEFVTTKGTFVVEVTRCIFCGYCQEACPKDAIELTRDYEFCGYTREEFHAVRDELIKNQGT